MARRTRKPPRCTQCIERGRNSKCNRKNPCASCEKAGTAPLCSYDDGNTPEPPIPPPPRQSITPPIAPPIAPRGVRHPIDRETPSNCYAPSRSTLSPPPPLPFPDVPPAPPIVDEVAHQRTIARDLRHAPAPQGDLAAKIHLLQTSLATLQNQVREEYQLAIDPIYRNANAEVRATPSVSQVMRNAVTPGKQAPAMQLLVSPVIHHIFKTGMRRYVPLTMLTSRRRQLNGDTSRHDMEVIKWNPRGEALVKDIANLSDPNEIHMPIEDWVDGWKCKLWLVEKYQPQVAQAWSDHYALIFHHPTFHTEFNLWLRYDITVRKRWVDEDFDPGTLQEGIYKMIDRELTIAARDNSSYSRPDQSSSHSQDRHSRARNRDSTYYHPENQPNAPQTSNNRGSRFHPYKQPSSYQNQSPNGPGAPTKCLCCGGIGHLPPLCSATTQANDVSAMCSMARKGVIAQTANTVLTYAPCVDPPVTPPSPAPIDPRKVVTPLIPGAWHSCLSLLGLLDKFSDVPTGLSQGFCFGASRSLSSTSTPPNHKSAQDAPEVIDAHIAKELSLGRYSGPFSHTTLFGLIGHFRSAPLGLVSKASSPGEYRMVQDFSYSHTKGAQDSVNDEINVDEFPCVWSFFDDVAQAMLDLPEGSMAATFDVDAAYRRIPIHPDDQPSMIVLWRDMLYVDHCAPFGAASSNGLFARCGDAMLLILQILLMCQVFKWVDDYLMLRPPSHLPGGSTSKEDVYSVADPLGWPWKTSKTKDFAPVFEFLGFLWNIPTRVVSIPPKKRTKFLSKIDTWLSSVKVSLRHTQQIIGSLVHCTNVIPDGQAWLAGLIRFSASFPHARQFCFVTRPIPDYASRDALWWRERLSSENCARHLTPPPSEYPQQFYMDASTSFGISIIVNNHWAAWRLMQGWKSDGRDIGWAEMTALELTLEAAIAFGLRETLLHFRSDNQGVVFAMASGRSRNTHQNDAIKRIYARSAIFGLRIRTSYITSAENPADPPSRGLPPPNIHPIAWVIPIPSHLASFLARASLV